MTPASFPKPNPQHTDTMKKFLSFLLGGLLFAGASLVAQAQVSIPRQILPVEAELAPNPTINPFVDGLDEFYFASRDSYGRYPAALWVNSRLAYLPPTPGKPYVVEVRAGAKLVGAADVLLPPGPVSVPVRLPTIEVPLASIIIPGNNPAYEVTIRSLDGRSYGVTYVYVVLQ